MNDSRRESRDIIYDILKKCEIPSGKTAIVYGCNLNFNNLTPYLSWCKIHGWLKKVDTKYITTDLGRSFIKLMEPIYVLEKKVI